MSGVSFWEFLFICMIGLVVLGPERLPKVANQIGSWVGQARRMTRTMRRQLEEEINLDVDIEKELGIKSFDHPPPHDDDSYSPLHGQPEHSLESNSSTNDAVANDPVKQQGEGTADTAAGLSEEADPDQNPDQNPDHGNEQQKLA